MNDVFKFEQQEGERELVLLVGPRGPLPHQRYATLSDIEAALAERGLCVVARVGAEPTDEELVGIELDGLGQGDDHNRREARRALYLAGQHSRDEEIARLMARVVELEASRERILERTSTDILDLDEAAEDRAERIAELEAQLATEKAAVADYVRLWEELTNKVSELSARAEAAEKRADETLDAYQSCLDELAETKALLLGAKRRVAELEALVASAQEDRARAVADLAQEARGGEEARAALTAEQQRRQEVERDRDGWRRAAESQNSQWSKKCAQLTDVRAKLEEAERERDEANERAANHLAAWQAKADLLAERNSDVQALRAELAACRKVVEAALRLRAKMARDDEGRPLIDNFAGSDFDDLDGACAIYEIGLTHEPERNAAERAARASAGKVRCECNGFKEEPAPSKPAEARSVRPGLAGDSRSLEPSGPAKSLRAQAREKLDALSDSQISNLWVSLGRLEPEPPPNPPGIPESSILATDQAATVPRGEVGEGGGNG